MRTFLIHYHAPHTGPNRFEDADMVEHYTCNTGVQVMSHARIRADDQSAKSFTIYEKIVEVPVT